MDLLGLPLLVALCTAAAVVLGGVTVLWNRWPRGVRWPARAVSLVLVMALGAVLAGDLVNRSFGLYASFDELFGTPTARYEPVSSFGVRPGSAGLQILTANWVAEGQRAAAQGRGIVLLVRLGGVRSQVNRKGYLYLPAGYFGPAAARFPALEFFHGTPGGPRNYVDQLHIAGLLDAEIAAGRIPPVVAVFPDDDGGRPGECIDGPRGLRDETYLAVDVPADLDSALRVLPGRSFAVVGYSTGGFCAVNLGLHHPDRYAAAASLSGYFVAGTDPTVGNPYGSRRALQRRNSPVWEVTTRRPTAPPLIVVSSSGDPSAIADQQGFVAAVRHDDPRLPLVAAVLPRGGHNFGTWSTALPPVLDRLAHFLPRDLAPPLPFPGERSSVL